MTESRNLILLIEDEHALREPMRDKLTLGGFLVLEAKNGEEGLAMALREHPDLILLDILMPVMDGMTMLAKLREDAWGKDAHVLMMTNLSDNEHVGKAMANGAFEYFVKSDWPIAELVKLVGDKLKKKENQPPIPKA